MLLWWRLSSGAVICLYKWSQTFLFQHPPKKKKEDKKIATWTSGLIFGAQLFSEWVDNGFWAENMVHNEKILPSVGR